MLHRFCNGSNINVKYAYKMEGVDDDWITLSNGTNVAYYNNLPNGKHTFKVKSTDENQRFSDFTRTIIIDKIPYWYESTLAYVFYALIIIGMIALGLWLYIKHIRAEARTTMQKELTQTKINYFTSISHELLTPLSVISYASEAITKKSGDTAEQASLISRNATRLKKLIKQVLEFWKMESGKLSVRMVKTDISQHLQHVISYYFIPLAQKKDIKLEYKIESDIIGTVDIDKVEMIVMNLLSNAIKYTPSGKIISVNAFTEVVDSKSTMKLTVTDQGIGIESNELSKIFTKYYSNPKLGSYESNGIGLALAKQMAVIHGGTIEVESEIGKGSVFTLTLPLDNNSETEVESFGDSISASQEASIDKNRKQENTNEDDSKPVILFIDDNDELLSLANDLFSDTYTVITSISGNKGLEILHDKNIDIIVCDLMMPDIDGIKLCAAVREDPTTCHIPIIILTARHGPDAQIESYKIGADGFLTKPIETGVLRARIDNLIKARQQREEIFSAETTINVDTLQLKSIDEDFLDHAIKCVEDNLSDADFDIAKLSDAMCMSRSTLSRKIKAVTGKTPLEFVSNIKLKYACSMLRRGDSISAVAYATGFSSPKYFSKCFKEEFSISPSEFQHKSSDK